LLSNKSFKKPKLIRENEKDYHRLLTDVKVYSKGIVAINYRNKNIELYKIVENDLVLMRELSESELGDLDEKEEYKGMGVYKRDSLFLLTYGTTGLAVWYEKKSMVEYLDINNLSEKQMRYKVDDSIVNEVRGLV
jgi:hypothetical protein